MDKLSPELMYVIFKHLHDYQPPIHAAVDHTSWLAWPRRRPSPPHRGHIYATVSRSWQSLAEAHSFTHINLKSSDLAAFASIFSVARRRATLRRLKFFVCLPSYGDSRGLHVANEDAASTALASLLSLLREWESSAANSSSCVDNLPGLQLSVQFHLDEDLLYDSDGPTHQGFDVSNSSASRRYLSLVQDSGAPHPSVWRVNSLVVDAKPGMVLHPTSLCQLAAAFPNLLSLELEYLDPAVKRRDLRREHRLALANGLASLQMRLPLLKRLRIKRLGQSDPANHSMASATLAIHDEDTGVDPLCASLRSLSQSGLEELELNDVILSPDLFRDCLDQSPMIWPRLQRLKITAGLLAPNGEWYYTGEPDDIEPSWGSPIDPLSDEDDDAEDSTASGDSADHERQDLVINGQRPQHAWRTRPNASFEALLQAFANAVSPRRAPHLVWASLDFGLEESEMVGVMVRRMRAGQVLVDAPGIVALEEDEAGLSRLLLWVGMHCAGQGWHVPEELLETVEEGGVKVKVGIWPVKKN